ncbi:DJ-1/PfpI family protein [Flavobacterium cutihirudinis]|uniref:DJ-1/PfpI family protein n=2 Tax=Flavobacterium cutihirudinis TaxID=1265740 RepID=A0A3D9FPV8_9FLAO|nr:DJ-1/PfpI family protein [Flavobacterium cutihirudinis]
MRTMNIAVLLFDDFETLDVYGPVEVFGRLVDIYSVAFYSLDGGQIKNKHGVSVLSAKLEDINKDLEIFLIPGGLGTRKEVENKLLIDKIKEIATFSKFVLTVCTGSALLARTGLLDNKTATSNKRAFNWVISNGINVNWNKSARWTIDDKYYTSSGVSAGIDMALGFISNRHGIEFARKIAFEIEYNWTEDKDNDTFKAE